MRNTKIKAVFVDLDGTLLQGVDTVSPRTRSAFAQIREAGILPVIATGRLAYEADFAVRAIGADGYMIAMNGLAVYEDYRTGALLYEAGMPENTTADILRILLEQNVFFEAYAGNRAWCQRDRAALIQHCGMDEEHIRFFSGSMEVTDDLTAHLSGRKVNKFFTSLQDPAEIPALRRALDALPGVRTLSAGEHYVEVVPEGADKQRAVRMVREALGLSKDQIMVIGDSENDLGMFDQAHTCVAMGNACPALKAKANYIAPSNCEDGVAWAVETLLLGESAPRLTGHIETIGGEEIARSLEHSTRQYLTGDLKLPQQLRFLYDPEVEAGISAYPYYRWEHPHYHTLTAEYCYILEGETKYIAHKLDNIIYFIDNNGYQLDGPTDDILRHGNLARKAEGFGLHTQEVDGHDVDAIYRAIVLAKSAKGVPSCIVLKTTKGKGATFAESSHEHSSQPKEEQWKEAIATAEKALEEIKNA